MALESDIGAMFTIALWEQKIELELMEFIM